MRRTALAMSFLAALAATAHAKKLRIVKEHFVSVEPQHKAPTFTPAVEPRLVDGGRLLTLGKGIVAEQSTFYLLDLKSLKKKKLEFDTAAWFDAHPDAFPRQGKLAIDTGFVEELVFVDQERKRAGMLVSTRRRPSSLYLVVGDLEKGTIDHHVLLGDTAKDEIIHAIPLGYADGAVHLIVEKFDNARKSHGVLARVTDGKLEELARMDPDSRHFSTTVFPDADGRRVLVPRYDEVLNRVTTTVGLLIDLDKGDVRELTLPTTTYGATFSADGSTLYTFSSDTGMLWKIDVASGEKLAELKVGKLGFPVGFFAPGRLALVKNGSVVEVDPDTMQKKQTVRLTTLKPGFWHVQNSFFIGATGRVVLKNGYDLYIARLK